MRTPWYKVPEVWGAIVFTIVVIWLAILVVIAFTNFPLAGWLFLGSVFLSIFIILVVVVILWVIRVWKIARQALKDRNN